MKTVFQYIIIIFASIVLFNCVDESKDPLNTNQINKGTILSLRGDELITLVNGADYAFLFFRDSMDSDTKFTYTAELLAEDHSTLKSADIFVRKNLGKEDGKVKFSSVLLKSILASEFKSDPNYVGPIVSVSLDLSKIIESLEVPSDAKKGSDFIKENYANGIQIWTNLNLTDGSVILAETVSSAGLYGSEQFYPAQRLTIGTPSYTSYLPVPSITRDPVRSFGKNFTSDTLFIKFNTEIETFPTVEISPSEAGTISKLSNITSKSDSEVILGGNYLFTASSTYTGSATFKVTGAVSKNFKLTQSSKSYSVIVDNGNPTIANVVSSLVSNDASRPNRIGIDQSIRLLVEFTEAMNGKVLPELEFVIGDAKILDIPKVEATPVIGSNTQFEYFYSFKSDKDLSLSENQTTDKVMFKIDGGEDKNGNSFVADPLDSYFFYVDLSVPSAPSVSIGDDHDIDLVIKWGFTQETLIEGMSTTGRVYWAAVASGEVGPNNFEITDLGQVFSSTEKDDEDKLVVPDILQSGEKDGIPISNGSSGTVYSPFLVNGTFDIYVCFVSDVGTMSAVMLAHTNLEMK